MRCRSSFLLLGIVYALPACAQEPETKGYDFSATAACAPTSFEAAVTCLKTTLPTGAREELLQRDGAIMAHHGFGTMLRNEWGLWNRASPLNRALVRDGFIHPDDMSAAIIDAYVAGESGKPFGKAAAISRYRDYWQKARKRTPLPIERCVDGELVTKEEVKACYLDGNGAVISELKVEPN